MTPESFIEKHITVALVAEGFPLSVAQGGQGSGWIITAAALRQAGRVACLMIVWCVPGCGRRGKPAVLSEKRARKKPGKWGLNPACFD